MGTDRIVGWTMTPRVAPPGTTVETAVWLPEDCPRDTELVLNIKDLGGATPGFFIGQVRLKAGVSRYTIDYEGDKNQYLQFTAAPMGEQPECIRNARYVTEMTERVVKELSEAQRIELPAEIIVTPPIAQISVSTPVIVTNTAAGKRFFRALFAQKTGPDSEPRIATGNMDFSMDKGDMLSIEINDYPELKTMDDTGFPSLGFYWGSRYAQGLRKITVSTKAFDFEKSEETQVIIDGNLEPDQMRSANGACYLYKEGKINKTAPVNGFFNALLKPDVYKWYINILHLDCYPIGTPPPGDHGVLFISVG